MLKGVLMRCLRCGKQIYKGVCMMCGLDCTEIQKIVEEHNGKRFYYSEIIKMLKLDERKFSGETEFGRVIYVLGCLDIKSFYCDMCGYKAIHSKYPREYCSGKYKNLTVLYDSRNCRCSIFLGGSKKIKKVEKPARRCVCCNKIMKPYRWNQRFCSEKCRTDFYVPTIENIRKDFLKLMKVNSIKAKEIADEMEVEEGKEFREKVLDGLLSFNKKKEDYI